MQQPAMNRISKNNIVVIGPSRDSTTIHFTKFLEKKEVGFQLIPLESLFQNGKVNVSSETGEFLWEDKKIVLNTVNQKIFARIILPVSFEGKETTLKSVLAGFLQRAMGIIINRPFAGSSNYSKAAQIINLKNAGLNYPETLLTNDLNKARSFFQKRATIYKSPSSVRSIVSLVDSKSEARLKYLHSSPVLFQKLIDGRDVRIHVVANKCFAEEISSKTIDYRYDFSENMIYKPIKAPLEIEKACIDLTRQMGLLFSGIDFKVDESGNYWFLEVNPMPGYEAYDQRLGYEISDALLDCLMAEK